MLEAKCVPKSNHDYALQNWKETHRRYKARQRDKIWREAH